MKNCFLKKHKDEFIIFLCDMEGEIKYNKEYQLARLVENRINKRYFKTFIKNNNFLKKVIDTYTPW